MPVRVIRNLWSAQISRLNSAATGKSVKHYMSESFADLFEESLTTIEMAPGSIVTGTVVDIDNDWVVVHAGLKSEGVIPKSQFVDENGQLNLNIGDQVKVAMEVVDDGFGETRLSREKARRAESWMMLDDAFQKNEVITGVINGKVKGGFTVDVSDIRAFLPGSLVDIRPLRETAHLEGKPLEFRSSNSTRSATTWWFPVARCSKKRTA